MGCPPEWKNCIDVGKWDDPMHQVFNSASKNYKKYMGTTNRVTASGKQLVVRENQLMRQGLSKAQVKTTLNKEFKNAKAIIHRERQLTDRGVPELKVHQILSNEFK